MVSHPKRKHPRLKQYDYSQPEYYYVTIHAEKKIPALSMIQDQDIYTLARSEPTELGRIAELQLLELENRFPTLKVDKYVIMPTHIHVIFCLTGETAGTSPRPTLMDIVGTYKSFTTRIINQKFLWPGRKLFQTSFYEEVLRSEKAYQACWRYIDENPAKWLLNPEDI